MLCDGGTYTVSSGSYTSYSFTTVQNLTTSYVDMNGSSIVMKLEGTTCVIYEFCFCTAFVDTNSIGHYKFFIDSDETS